MGRTLAVVLLVLIIIGGTGSASESALDSRAIISSTVTKAVEDNSWIYISTKDELKSFLGEIYTGELLEELFHSVYEVIAQPQGIHERAIIRDHKVYILGRQAYVIAQLDLLVTEVDGEKKEAHGIGFFKVKQVEDNWLIYDMKFSWNYL